MELVIDFILDNLSIIISMLALMISIINIIYLVLTNKKKLQFEINNYSSGKVNNKNYYFFDVEIINKSRLPISVNEITIESNKQNYTFIKASRLLLKGETKKGKEVTDRYEIHSIKFPININGLCSEQEFIVMYGPNEFNDNVKITLKTSRGKIKKKIKNMCSLKIDDNTFFEELSKYK